ncbi:response regulator transcription factor [Emcibacter sp.]|uniref:response regulator transcription factor n=1 Tax=Emcibacter sp. TaxID=1979954 RepID=UPI003A8DBEC8
MSESSDIMTGWYDRLAELYTNRGSDRFLPLLADALMHLAKADSMLILRHSDNTQPVFLYTKADHSLRKRNIGEYLSGPYLLDPFYQISDQYQEPGFVHLKDISGEGFYEGEYYDSWIKFAGLKDEVNYFIPVEDGEKIVISLSRNLNNWFFNEGAIEKLKQVLPLIDRIVCDYWTKSRGDLVQEKESLPTLHESLQGAMDNFGRSVLTEREFEIVQYLLRGHSIKSTAERLGISPTTIKVHRKHIYQKLDIASHSELFSLFLDALSIVRPGQQEDPLISYN